MSADEATSSLTGHTLLCEPCSRPYDAGLHLQKTGEDTDETAEYEHFQCPECGATGGVQQRHDLRSPTYFGCVTTPRLLDLKEISARSQMPRGGPRE